MSPQSDVPAVDLAFVDPDEVEFTYRGCLWAAPGAGKSVAAASAPGPILVVTADRPSAYRFARKHWRDVEAQTRAAHDENPEVPIRPAAEIREVRYQGPDTLTAVYRYLDSDEGAAIRTVVIDPVGNIIDQLREVAPPSSDGDIDHQWVNKQVLRFVQGLRRFDVNVVLVAHERLNDGKKGDGKLYPALGGATLINKLLAELDFAAHIERVEREVEGADEAEALWIGQLQPRDNLVCKEATGVLGDRRVADLTRWFDVATEALTPADADLPWDDSPQANEEPPAAPQTDAPPASDGAAAPRSRRTRTPKQDSPAELPPAGEQPELGAAA